MSNRILIIGAVPHPGKLKTYGGTTTLMQNFLDWCKSEGHSGIRHIDTLRFGGSLLNPIYFLLQFLYGVLTCRVVMYNVSVNGAFKLFYFTAPLAYALGRKVVFRKFGGNFLRQLEACPSGKRLRMVDLLNRCSLVYFETRALVEEAPMVFRHPDRIRWFPNCRKPSSVAKLEPGYHKRFVFISHMREAKGVDLLLEAADKLPEDYVVDLYGSIHDGKYANPDYFSGHRARYCGALSTEEVLPALAKYDVLVLPTYCATEGYPGIIIEAMSLGIPTIATRLGGIPELISDGDNGILITPQDADALRQAILGVSADNYTAMAQAARKRFDAYFNSNVINNRVWGEMQSL